MATILIRASGGGVRSLASRGSAVVVMEPPENRDSRDAALELGGTRNRLLLRESLVRTRLVVEAHELGDEASEVDLAEEDIVGLHEVARPRDVIPQEGRPALPVAAGPRATHVPLDGSLADADAELEQLAAEALRAPARIAGGHLSDKRRTRGRGSTRRPG